MQPGSVRLEINGRNLTPDLAGPVQTQPSRLDHLNVFCVHAALTDQVGLKRAPSGNVEDLRRRLLIPEKCFDLGEHAVVIMDTAEFRRRFNSAIAGLGPRQPPIGCAFIQQPVMKIDPMVGTCSRCVLHVPLPQK